MTDPVVLGADLGTSGLKLAALDPAGSVVVEIEREYPIDRPHPGWAETDVAVWCRALDEALDAVCAQLRGRSVAALGLSGQMHGAVLVAEDGTALAPAMLWPDRRAAAELQRWRELPDADRAALANPLAAGMTGPMVAWLTAHRPELVARARAVLLPKDAVRAALVRGTDPAVTDRSDASATLLWDVPRERWSAAATAVAGIDPDLLPAVLTGDTVVGTTTASGTEVPVVVGGADTSLALLAAGTGSGVQVNLGSGAQVIRRGVQPAPAADPVVHCFADADRGWYAMAALQNAGTAWSWVQGVLGLDWGAFAGSLAASAPGAGGVVFSPFLTGERGGVAGPDARAGWTGLSADTTRADLARAALEGVACAVAAALDLLGHAGNEVVVLTGGGARDPGVQQLLADVLDQPVQHARVRSASAAGAAVLAARGVGRPLVPVRSVDRLVEPRRAGAAAAVRERWAAAVG